MVTTVDSVFDKPAEILQASDECDNQVDASLAVTPTRSRALKSWAPNKDPDKETTTAAELGAFTGMEKMLAATATGELGNELRFKLD